MRKVAEEEPALAARALQGLGRYGRAHRHEPAPPRPAIASQCGASLRDHGGGGSPVVLIPSLINPPHVLDLPGRSLAAELARHHRVLLVDWGKAADRRDLDVGGHVEKLLLPLLEAIGEAPALIGYCLGGTMAVAAASLLPVPKLVTLAAPWRFGSYPSESRAALASLWRKSAPAADRFGVLPTEVLQAAFWSLDPHGIVAKFAALADEPPDSPAADRFIALEDWANEGEPLPLPAAREMIEELFVADLSGSGTWRVAGKAIAPPPSAALHFTATNDRIVPSGTAPPGRLWPVAAGHVGMIVGRHAPVRLHRPLVEFLAK